MKWKRKVKDRARTFELVAWRDNPAFYDIIEYLKDLSDSCYVYHDKDIVTEETIRHFEEAGLVCPFGLGELKTPHIHAVFRYPNARYTKAVREEIGIDTVFPVESKRGALRYLIHMDYEDKYQYSQSDVHCFGKMSDDFKKAIAEDVDFCVKVIQLMAVLEDEKRSLTTFDFVKLMCDCDLFPVAIQMKGWAFRLLEDHNIKYLPKIDESEG